jgi:extracellular elastinolytic metalloproteinase
MVEVTPDKDLESDIFQNYHRHLARMSTSQYEEAISEGFEASSYLIEHVPDAVSPVKATPALMQVPTDDATELITIYKVR